MMVTVLGFAAFCFVRRHRRSVSMQESDSATAASATAEQLDEDETFDEEDWDAGGLARHQPAGKKKTRRKKSADVQSKGDDGWDSDDIPQHRSPERGRRKYGFDSDL